MLRILLCLFALVLGGMAFACSSTPAAPGSAGDNPTEAYKRLYAAVKSKDTEAIKACVTKATEQFAAATAEKYQKPVEEVYRNGFTATTFADSLPPIRDQRENGDMGAVEVWNAKSSSWEDLPFIKEDNVWKLAVGDIFKGSYKSPGPGRSQREKMAANASGERPVEAPMANANGNANIHIERVPMPAANENPTASEKAKPPTGK
ncbi:MAG: hypothetical protein LC113_02170 [Acidobacteria bacterium]|nr:hypothetical protein [Acidobacteriota bacterium]